MSKQNEKLDDEHVNLLIANGNIAIQFDQTANRVAVGLPFALEYCANVWWICCPEGRFQLRLNLPVLWSRQHSAEDAKWVSIMDFYWGVVAYQGQTEKPLDIGLPINVEPKHADWLLAFVRTCLVVQVASTPVPPNVMPDAKASVPVKSRGLALGRVRVRTRRYRASSRSWRR